MTDARIPERYLMDRRVVRLTDTQRSSYFMATLWSVSNRTDGRIDREDLALIPTFNPAAVDALVARGLWEPTDTGWLDVEFERTQTSRRDLEVLENVRRAGREKKARQRAKAKSPGDGPPGHVPGDNTGQDRTGKDRTGKANYSTDHDSTPEPVIDWPVATIPPDAYCRHGVTIGGRCSKCPAQTAALAA